MGKINLTPDQEKLFVSLSVIKEFTDNFYFTGGTALSVVYLSHRTSDDLDFFSDQLVPLDKVSVWINEITASRCLKPPRYEKTADRNIFYLPLSPELKIEFTYYPYPNLEAKTEYRGIRTDSLKDIAVNKLLALVDRNEPKDFYDLFYLIPKIPVSELVDGVQKKFGLSLSRLTLGTEFLKVRKLAKTQGIRGEISTAQIIGLFESEARKLGEGLLS
jgi:predicted nucleotidyltransferase component of viral defense system